MADKKSVGHAYNIDFLNVVFAASSLFLFFSSLWMVWDDYDREWKGYQRQFVLLETEVTQAGLVTAQSQVDQAELARLQAEREAAEQSLVTNQAQIAELQGQLSEVEAELYAVNQTWQFTKAEYDVERYAFEGLQDHDPEHAAEERPAIDAMYAEWIDLGLQVDTLTATRDGIRGQIGEFTGQVAELDQQIRELTTDTTRLQGRLVDLAPSVVTDALNAPLLDFMAPTITVKQIITPEMVDDVNFTRVLKMDRCTSCHLGIDRVGYEDYPQPFTTHPNLESYVGSASAHPVGQFGCTVCHEGMGQSINFEYASHTPRDAEQMAEWEEEHHWEVPHLWDYPMLPTDMTEASCAKCHQETVFVPDGPDISLAYGIYERAGCYACHTTTGFQDLRKPGPNLTKIAAKLDEEWVATWIRDPRAVKSSTWMPRVWYNSNSSAPEDARRNEAEIDAVVAYLFANSEWHEVAVSSPRAGDAARGQEVVESVGCLGCHITDDMDRLAAGPRRTFGQPLQNIGNKTTYEWLFDWVRDPKHFNPDTYMPDLRLTDREVADVATYLTSLTGPDGEAARATYEQPFVAEVLADYLTSIVPAEEAHATVAAMSPEEQQLDLGRRAIARYGCYSCHEIAGFEDTQPIGIELSEEGSKLIQRLDFAFVHDIPHTKVDWFRQKLSNPREFDRSRVLQPLERLRMPYFGFSDDEVRLLSTAIMSFQVDVQPVAARVPGSARNDALRAGRNFVRRRNCVGCHEIEGDGGDYRSVVDDPSLAPPLLTPTGAKVKADWLYAFLRRPITIRPWLDVRMPTFGLEDPHLNDAIDYFAAISESVGPFRTHDLAPEAGELNAGEELFSILQCQACHVLDTIPADRDTDNLAPDLRMAHERLQPDWVIDWLREPLEIQPGTKMPQYWAELPGSFFEQLDNDGVRQIEALRDYLYTFRGGPSPFEGN